MEKLNKAQTLALPPDLYFDSGAHSSAKRSAAQIGHPNITEEEAATLSPEEDQYVSNALGEFYAGAAAALEYARAHEELSPETLLNFLLQSAQRAGFAKS